MKWLPIKDYEYLYEISELGHVRSIRKGHLLSIKPNKQVKYLQVNLWKNNKGKNFYIHRLLAQAFIPNSLGLPEVNHKDGNRQNNSLDNLEWVDRKGNALHAIETGLKQYSNKLTEEQFYNLLQDIINGETYHSISKRVDYQVPYLSVKLRSIAKKYGLEDALDKSLKQQHLNRLQNIKSAKLRVQQFTLDGDFIAEYESTREAAKAINGHSGAISNAVSGRTKTSKGFLWKSA